MIQITDDQVLNGQHLRVQHTYGTDGVSSFLIQQGGGEVDEDPAARRHGGGGEAVLRQGFAKHLTEEERYWGGEGLRLGSGVQPSPRPSIYRGRGKGEGGRPPLDKI